MTIAIISDTHDQEEKVLQVIDKIKELKLDAIIHCGDWCSPFMVDNILTAKLPVYTCMGNNDGDRDALRSKLQHSDLKFELEDEILELTLDGKRFGINHYPDIADVLINSHKYDLVCFGHNHTRQIDKLGNAWLINPGALIHNVVDDWGFVVYDTQKNNAKFITL